MSKLNIPSYSALIPRDKQIKSIIDLYENVKGIGEEVSAKGTKVLSTNFTALPTNGTNLTLDGKGEDKGTIVGNICSGQRYIVYAHSPVGNKYVGELKVTTSDNRWPYLFVTFYDSSYSAYNYPITITNS